MTVRRDEATYLLEDAMTAGGTTLDITHQGQGVTLETGTAQTLPVSVITPITPEPTQPAGRRPMPVEEVEDAAG